MAEEEDKLTTTGTDVTIAVVVLLVILGIFGAYLRSIFDSYLAFVEWWYSKNWGGFFLIVSILFAVFDLFLIWFIIFTLRRHAKLDQLFPEAEQLKVQISAPDEEVRTVWEEIERLANSVNPSDWNMAIIRADGLFDDVLKRFVTEGETMADRLKIVDPTKIPSLDRIWSAHRLRNTVVHGPLQEHTKETITHALESYKLGLTELGVFKTISA